MFLVLNAEPSPRVSQRANTTAQLFMEDEPRAPDANDKERGRNHGLSGKPDGRDGPFSRRDSMPPSELWVAVSGPDRSLFPDELRDSQVCPRFSGSA